ncbi:hypothetical protein DFH06DRAFT_1320674 [Mycena polygramma]|nr:hypothetical protein DFH06DRAFT_1320674 [Mycena polygramma]
MRRVCPSRLTAVAFGLRRRRAAAPTSPRRRINVPRAACSARYVLSPTWGMRRDCLQPRERGFAAGAVGLERLIRAIPSPARANASPFFFGPQARLTPRRVRPPRIQNLYFGVPRASFEYYLKKIRLRLCVHDSHFSRRWSVGNKEWGYNALPLRSV